MEKTELEVCFIVKGRAGCPCMVMCGLTVLEEIPAGISTLSRTELTTAALKERDTRAVWALLTGRTTHLEPVPPPWTIRNILPAPSAEVEAEPRTLSGAF